MSSRSQITLQKAVSEFSGLIYEKGWVANHDGNISARLADEKRFMVTPTAESKRGVVPHDTLVVDMEGKRLSGRKRLFSEWHLHATCFKARPDVNAVIHAHPIYATAIGVAKASLGIPTLPEMVVSLGANIPTLDYAMPKSVAQEMALAQSLTQGDADGVLLSGNGVIVVGVDLEQAFLRLELIEHYAQILSVAASFGGAKPMPSQDVEALLAKRTAAGLGRAGRLQPN